MRDSRAACATMVAFYVHADWTVYWKQQFNRRRYALGVLGYADYRDYLLSPFWATLRAEVLLASAGRCAKCRGKATEVHHENYELSTLKGESRGGLVAVCRKCHQRLTELGLKATGRPLRGCGPVPYRPPSRPPRKTKRSRVKKTKFKRNWRRALGGV